MNPRAKVPTVTLSGVVVDLFEKALSAVFAFALSVAVSPVMAADSRGASFPAPGQVRVMVAPATTAIASSAHYQAYMGLQCDSYSCIADFPKPGRKHRLNVTRIACDLHGSVGSAFDQAFVFLRDSADNVVFREDVPVDFSSSGGQHTINRGFDMQVGASQYLEIRTYLASGTMVGALCSVIGTLETLQ
jgi:hypothetical protein